MKPLVFLLLALLGILPLYSNDLSQVQQAERLVEEGHTTRSLLMLNKVIDKLSHKASNRADSVLLLRACRVNANNYRTIGNRQQSLSLLRKAIGIASSMGDKKTLAKLYNNVFGVYYELGEYERADELLKKSLELNIEAGDSAAIRDNYNNLGLLFYERRQYPKALEYMSEALRFTAVSDRIGRSLIYTNRGEVFQKQGYLRKTEAELAKAMSLQEGCKFDPRTVQTALNMALVKAKLGKRREAKGMMPTLYADIPRLPVLMQANSYEQLADVHFVLGDSLAALRDILKYQAINDSLQRTTSDDQLQELLVAYDAQRLKQKNADLEQSVSLYKVKVGARTVIAVCVSVFLVILAVLLFVLARRMKLDRRKSKLISEQREMLRLYEQQEHDRRQKELSMEIDHKNRQLTSYTIDLAAMNEFHLKISRQLELLRGATCSLGDEEKASIADMIHSLAHFNDKSLGEDFRVYFDEVHPDLLRRLSQRYPILGKKDLRLCAYLHLGMSTKEIAALTFREVRSVESQRNRLRKKLGLSPDTDLQSFLNAIESGI